MSRPLAGPLLEVIVLDAEDARAARDGGADRLELIADMAADGLTPSRETYVRVRAAVALPVRVMLRDRTGFATGGDAALDALCERARELRAEGADEFVMGFLDEAGRADVRALAALDEAVAGCAWTFHRAVDRAADRDRLRRDLAESANGRAGGLDSYLTAGSAHGVDAGMDVLLAEAARTAASEPGYAPRIIAGGGLRLDHVPRLAAAGVTAFHIGGPARRGGREGKVDAGLVALWREALDA